MRAKQNLKIGGFFKITCYDKDGNLKWRESKHNLVTDVGINHILDVQFHGVTQVNPWYVGLKQSGTPVVGDTLASHSSWLEQDAYAGDRKEFVETAAAGKSISNTGNVASFTINASDTWIYGALLASVATGTGGILFCVVDFDSDRKAGNGDVVTVEYTINGSDV